MIFFLFFELHGNDTWSSGNRHVEKHLKEGLFYLLKILMCKTYIVSVTALTYSENVL